MSNYTPTLWITGDTISSEKLNKLETGLASAYTDIVAQFGAPLVASTVSSMTDTNRVYVYTGSETGYTDGNWYYYNGSAWVSGGVYNSVAFETDKTLLVEDKPADGKATGDAISQLNNKLKDIWNLNLSSLTWSKGFINNSGNADNTKSYMRSSPMLCDYDSAITLESPDTTEYNVAIAVFNGESFFKRFAWHDDVTIHVTRGQSVVFMLHAMSEGADTSSLINNPVFLASIPASQTGIVGIINDIRITSGTGELPVSKWDWESGFYNNSGAKAGSAANTPWYIRTSKKFKIDSDDTFIVDTNSDDYMINSAIYDSSNVFVKRTGWNKHARISITAGQSIAFMIMDVARGDISDKTADAEFLGSFSIVSVGTNGAMLIDYLNEDKKINILGIGNSYTYYVFRYLSKIIAESGAENVMTGQCYKGGNTLQDMWEHKTDSEYFNYYRIYGGALSNKDVTGMTLEDALSAEAWDYIVFQQQSDYSGQYDSYFNEDFDLNDFIAWVKAACPNAKIGIVAPWTHAEGYTGEKFIELYNGNVAAQDVAIKTTIPRVANAMDQCDFVVDWNTLVDKARENGYLGELGVEMLMTDKNHIDRGIPAYMCGVLYAMNLGIDVSNLTWFPTVTEDSAITSDTNGYLAWIARLYAKAVYTGSFI